MATLAFVHAHPDDETITTGGSMARAATDGHRVVLVVCTNGELGEVPDDLAEGETLFDRRRAETERSAAVLGVQRIAWLGYRDSGMTGWEQNKDPRSFLRADPHEAADRLAAVLREERADLVVVYDWHGVYGHPDHVQAHRVGHAAADRAGTAKRFEVTFNRDAAKADMAAMVAADIAGFEEFDPAGPSDDGNPFGTPAAEIDLAVDVSEYVTQKRTAIACHSSQVTDTGMFLALPEELFSRAFGTEWYIDPGASTGNGPRAGWLLD